ncbi:predicted protein [Streptomyces filamentosus NRRL 15998]|uniref:Predicted protein n=1 Tax=Streptomyces filamentosus NRRL 15998 TaxID=457431 RepID=D6AV61_STRFL|nr:predicted protein [Streptomyces filamentosus NRRL 15998]
MNGFNPVIQFQVDCHWTPERGRYLLPNISFMPPGDEVTQRLC